MTWAAVLLAAAALVLPQVSAVRVRVRLQPAGNRRRPTVVDDTARGGGEPGRARGMPALRDGGVECSGRGG